MVRTIFAAGISLAIASTICTAHAADGIKALVDKPGVYTLVNLHPDEARAKMYSINYLQHGLIPLCTEVTITKKGRKRLRFTVVESGRKYVYDYHGKSGESFDANLAKYFGTECNTDKVKQLGELDQKGIKRGRALPGMSKQGVIYAIGYPPKHVTPHLDMPEWRYWKNRFNSMVVIFDDNDVVEGIRD